MARIFQYEALPALYLRFTDFPVRQPDQRTNGTPVSAESTPLHRLLVRQPDQRTKEALNPVRLNRPARSLVRQPDQVPTPGSLLPRPVARDAGNEGAGGASCSDRWT
jgi:hypothetical protein